MSALSPEQLARLQEAVRAGDAVRYYRLLAEFGFGYGIIAGRVVQKADLTGYIADYFFENKLREHGIQVTPELRAKLMQRLMVADFRYRQTDGVVTLDQIGQYHADVYRRLGIPADAWAPNFLHERGADALWCSLCTEAELGGQSRLGALGEVAGDVVDDLTGEVFDLGSGPSEGAARNAAELLDDLFVDGVLPRAFRDDLSDELFPKPESEPPSPLLHETSWYGSELREPVTRNLGGGRHTVEMSIAPGQTRTARVQLPGLTLELNITMPV